MDKPERDEQLVPVSFLVPAWQRDEMRRLAKQEQLKASDIGRRMFTFFLSNWSTDRPLEYKKTEVKAA